MRLIRRSWMTLGLAACVCSATSLPAFAGTPCASPGTVVVTDPDGDIATPAHDITGIVMAEVFGGTHAGKFRVTVQLAATEPPDTPTSGWWSVSWRHHQGDSTVTLMVRKCEESLIATWQFQSADGKYIESGAVDAAAFRPDGDLEIVLSRDKFHDPPPGAELSEVNGFTIPQEVVPVIGGCVPQFATDATGTGTYIMGSCVVAAPLPVELAGFSLGPPLPNPARFGVHFALRVPATLSGEAIEAKVFDAAGRWIRNLATSEAGVGGSTLEWNLSDESGRRVPPGSYRLRVTVAGRTITRAISVVR